jgi:mono/diheme cytochrome c family protein
MKPPASFLPEKMMPTGKLVFQAYCSVCHGDAAVGGGVVPDVRWSGALTTPEAWKAVVLDGSHSKNGMVAFAPVLPPDLAELVRGYVVARANETFPGP